MDRKMKGRKRKELSESEVEADATSESKAKKLKTNVNEPSTSSKTNSKLKFEPLWEDYELLVGVQGVDEKSSKKIVKLFEEESTIPFMARYRKDQTGNLSAEQLREVKEEYDKVKVLKSKIKTAFTHIEKSGKLNPAVQKLILGVQSVEELEHIYAPFKPGAKRTLAERAKALGLEEPALNLLSNSKSVDLERYVQEGNKELATYEDVRKGVIHIIATVIATDPEILSLMKKLRVNGYCTIECEKSSGRKDDFNLQTCSVEELKFVNYFDFSMSSVDIKPHQILAINRGESLKILSVKVIPPEYMYKNLFNFCADKWISMGKYRRERVGILEESVDDSYKRLIKPHIIRQVRSHLKERAVKASCDVFSTNLKQLLLMSPLKGVCILGIDPGFSSGCQLAMISKTGSLLAHADIFPHIKSKNGNSASIIMDMLKAHNCTLIALGNGTACRETEAWFSDLIEKNAFTPLDVVYTIVNESGASVYSCSAEAKKEFPSLDPKIISAVSLARRVQEPLAELVKVDPKNLGIGMYQHDLPKKQLQQALEDVISECVSFVGVDLNTTSQCLLRKIAGLTDKRATDIINYREKHGSFKSRQQLKNIKGIGARIFEQCAGFLRVEPANTTEAEEFYKDSETNRLDCTYIHPESYDVTKNLLKYFELNFNSIGQSDFIETVKLKSQNLDLDKVSKSLNIPVETLRLIISALSQSLNYDLRNENNTRPLFKKGLNSISDLKIGSIVTGSVTNVTHFGCFVDIGVGTAGLIHTSKMGAFNLQIGDKVETKVINVEIDRKRIGLEMLNLI